MSGDDMPSARAPKEPCHPALNGAFIVVGTVGAECVACGWRSARGVLPPPSKAWAVLLLKGGVEAEIMADDVDDADYADYARRLVAQRIPELSDADIAAALADGMSAEFADLALAVVDAMAERLDQLEMRLDDSRHTSYPPGRDRAAA